MRLIAIGLIDLFQELLIAVLSDELLHGHDEELAARNAHLTGHGIHFLEEGFSN